MSRPAVVALIVVTACAPSPRIAPPPEPKAFAPVASTTDAGAPPADDTVDLVMNPEDCSSPPRASITRADALIDLRGVERVIRGGWAGFETRSKEGVDFDAIFRDAKKWIASASEPIETDAFMSGLVERLRPTADNHMAFFHYSAKGHSGRKSTGQRERAFTGDLVVLDLKMLIEDPGKPRHGAELVGCEGHDLEKLLRPTVYTGRGTLMAARRPIILATQPPPALKCTLRLESKKTEEVWISMRPLGQGKTPPKTPVVAIEDKPLATIKLRSFWIGGHASELEAFAKSADRLRSAKAIVVDLRGNAGGSDMYARRWFSELTTGTLGGTIVDLLESDVTREGIFNANLCEIATGNLDPEAKKETQERLDHARLVLDTGQRAHERFRRWRPPRTSIVEGKASAPFKAPLVVLVDNQCASACESFLSIAHGVERAVVIGENSEGSGIFAEVVEYRLPKSGLGMSAGMKYFHATDPKNDIAEGRGYPPDLWLDIPPNDDALPLATRIAECLTKPTCALAKK